MQILVHAKFPTAEFNNALRAGTVEQTMGRILDETKPEAVYFTEYGGLRGAIMIFDISDQSQVPGICEPWFLAFNATVEFHIVMTPDDLRRAGLAELAKKWA